MMTRATELLSKFKFIQLIFKPRFDLPLAEFIRSTDPEPSGEVHASLPPCECPRDGPQAFNPTFGITLGRSAPDI